MGSSVADGHEGAVPLEVRSDPAGRMWVNSLIAFVAAAAYLACGAGFVRGVRRWAPKTVAEEIDDVGAAGFVVIFWPAFLLLVISFGAVALAGRLGGGRR